MENLDVFFSLFSSLVINKFSKYFNFLKYDMVLLAFIGFLFFLSSFKANSNLSLFSSINAFILNKLCWNDRLGTLYPLSRYFRIKSLNMTSIDFWKLSDIDLYSFLKSSFSSFINLIFGLSKNSNFLYIIDNNFFKSNS